MTGVSAHTLRAWERRYGVPRPMRTESTYRLYSQRDVDQIRAIRSLCEQGLSASEAAALSGDPAAAAQRVPAAPDATAHQQVADRLVTATFALDGAEIERLLALATAAGPPHVVLEQVLRPAALRVGELWERGA
ncbi:MAG TPA: MerR family transcriptional regulator, partial [Polyangiaceae bacterium]|nr:MerR family transcriptional regulator [Polyangiaceae bacterium]